MIRKNNKKVIPYNNDYEPVKVVQDNEVIFNYEKKTASGKEVYIISEYKPKPLLKINGDESQIIKDVNVESVNGIGLKYNQLVDKSKMTSTRTTKGITITNNSDGSFTLNGTATSDIRNEYVYSGIKSNLPLGVSRYFYLSNCSGNGWYLGAIGDNYSGAFIEMNGSIKRMSYGFQYIALFVNSGTTINNVKITLQIADLTDMFGAGNEPTTLEQFYATIQGKKYKSYVEYGYHILGACEYLSNQMIKNGDFSQGLGYWEYKPSNVNAIAINNRVEITALKDVSGDDGYIMTRNTLSSSDNNKMILLSFDAEVIEWNGNENSDFAFGYQGSGAGTTYFSHEESLSKKKYSVLIKASASSYKLNSYFQVYNGKTGMKWAFGNIVLHILDDINCQDLTLDQLKSQRPDLFVPQPYHTTEKRIGVIFNDGSVDRLDIKKVKLKDLNFVKFGSTNNFYVDIPDMPLNTVVLSNKYSYSTSLSGDKIIWNQNYAYSSHNLVLVDRSYDNATDLKNSFTDDDYVEYQLANPQPLYAVNDIKDEYKTNGVVNRKFGVVDLGSLNVSYATDSNTPRFLVYFPSDCKQITDKSVTPNIIAPIYKTYSDNDGWRKKENMSIYQGIANYWTIFNNSFTDATAFKTAMSGVYLIYELTTPTTELREPIAEDKVLPIVNEPYTQSVEQTPSPSYPREIEHTSKFKWNDLELPLDLYNGDKIIASRKVGKNIASGKEEGSYDIYSTTLKKINNVNIERSTNLIKVKPNTTYTFSKSNSGIFDIWILGIRSDGITYITDGSYHSTLKMMTGRNAQLVNYFRFTTSPTTEYIVWYSTHQQNDDRKLTDIQIEEGSTVTSYEPYLKNKVWQHQANATYVFTGQESWTGLGSEHNNNFYNATILSNAKFEHDIYVICDILKGQVSGGADGNYKNSIWLQSNSQYTRLYINIAQDNVDVDLINRILKDHKVIYPLATPQWIDLTDSLGALLNDLTPNATQEFSVDNGTLQVDYYKAKE